MGNTFPGTCKAERSLSQCESLHGGSFEARTTPMSTFAETVMEDLKAAMKAKDTVALSTLRALKTALTNAAIESGNKDNVVEEADALAIVRKQIKQRQDSIEQFEGAGRPELAEGEKAEIVVLEKYLLRKSLPS